jgi:hypothetical protein
MSEENNSYEQDVSVDPNSLEVEWTKQSKIYMKWAKLTSMADKKVKDLKEKLEFIDAQIDKEYRAKNSGIKFTEAMVKAAIIEHEDHKKAIEDFNNALYQYNMCSNVVRSLDHKKSALENLVKLWQGSYFAGPKEPRDLSKVMNMQEKWQERAEEKREEVSNDIKSRRRRRTAE